MVRSMFSGVSGLRTHQTRMDTIGNNIANVNTYGFKSGRTTFRDIYYQGIASASSPTAALGGMNPSSVGYGSKVGSVDLMMGRSTFTMTDQTMDIAIDGDGFIQVQDAAGNLYYTRAGMLNFDAAGNLVDMQGNFVLGINGDPTGRAAGSERIMVTLPPVNPSPASVVQNVNGKEFTISASNTTVDSNLNMNFTTNASLADGEIKASIATTGIIITMHPDTKIQDPNGALSPLQWLNEQINKAITAANGGVPHAAGDINVAYSGAPGDNPFIATNMPPIGYYTAEDLVSTNYSIKLGTGAFTTTTPPYGGVSPTGTVGNTFGAAFTAGTGAVSAFACAYDGASGTFTYTMTVGGQTYEGTVDSAKNSSGKFIMANTNGDETDFIEMSRPKYSDILDSYTAAGGVAGTSGSFAAVAPTALNADGSAPVFTASSKSYSLGFSGTAFAMRGGTAGGPQTIADMTGIYIAPNGIIQGLDSIAQQVIIGRIDIVTFANPGGLNQAGSSNFTESANSGAPILNQPGTGGAGKLVSGSLELSNVDLSREFSDMITTQRGYQANSRIITVSDTMLEELINLKR